jgi:hypothetical protein
VTTKVESFAVKNISRGPQCIDGHGMLEAGNVGDAADTEHTAALIDAGLLLRMPDEKPAAAKTSSRAAEKDGE